MKPHLASSAPVGTWPAGLLGDHGRRLALACVALIAACPVAAKAPEEMGPTASASIGISLSVAKRYSLSVRAIASERQGLKQQVRGQYCLASNMREMHLPVMLVRVSPNHEEENIHGAATDAIQLLPCNASGEAPNATDKLDESAVMREVIVIPE